LMQRREVCGALIGTRSYVPIKSVPAVERTAKSSAPDGGSWRHPPMRPKRYVKKRDGMKY
jgi:hypothetical protein